jgi:hypothetical protein
MSVSNQLVCEICEGAFAALPDYFPTCPQCRQDIEEVWQDHLREQEECWSDPEGWETWSDQAG